MSFAKMKDIKDDEAPFNDAFGNPVISAIKKKTDRGEDGDNIDYSKLDNADKKLFKRVQDDQFKSLQKIRSALAPHQMLALKGKKIKDSGRDIIDELDKYKKSLVTKGYTNAAVERLVEKKYESLKKEKEEQIEEEIGDFVNEDSILNKLTKVADNFKTKKDI
jgi:hypothetical protein